MILRKSPAAYVLPALYVALAGAVQFGVIQEEGSWAWFFVFVAGLPASLVGMFVAYAVGPFLAFSILGGAQWYVVNCALVDTVHDLRARLARRGPRRVE
jgi:hypothetical protein